MLTHRLSLLLAYAVVLTCSGAAPPPPPPPAGGAMAAQAVSQDKYFPPIPPASAFDTTSEWSDHRRLTVGDCPRRCRPGPLASIHPRAAAALWSEEHRDSGEVIAILISDSAYKKFNLQYRGREKLDTVYWAVIKRGDETVSIFRSTTPGTPDLVTTTEVVHHTRGFFRGQSVARFIWNDRDDMVWGTCDGGACCRSPRM
jgi:hypothetical protein